MAVALKVGPWGPQIGEHQDIDRASKPQSLEKITIWSSESSKGRIFGFSFKYVDQNGSTIAVRPWGQPDPKYGPKEVKMDSGEYLEQVSGTTDDVGITSLKLVTNRDMYPFGHQEGRTFVVTLQPGNGEVVAFFGRSSDTLTALGVYVLGKNGLPVKIGPFGDHRVTPVDINTPVKLRDATVYSTQAIGERIKGFYFTYFGQDRRPTTVGPWGTNRGQENPPINLNPAEYVNNISGSFDDYGVTSLTFTTNQNNDPGYGPYGSASGIAFSVPLPADREDNGAVVGFFGDSGSGESLLALGVYVGLAPKP